MVQVTLQMPDELAERLLPSSRWLPAILELRFADLTTPARATADEVVAFLMTNPSAQAVRAFHVSDEAQDRARRLLTLNSAGLLGESEQQELDELERVEHWVVMLKAGLHDG